MSYYQPKQQNEQQDEQRKKKVEWSPNLSSSQPQSTENKSPIWDSEAGHMLSYFLDANGVGSPPPAAQFPSNKMINHGNVGPYGGAMPSIQKSALSDRILQHPFRNTFPNVEPSNLRRGPLLGTDHSQNYDYSHNDIREPPPTPVIQHYYPSSLAVGSPSSSHPSSGRKIDSNASLKAKQAHLSQADGESQHMQQPQNPRQQQAQYSQQQRQQPLDPMQAMTKNFLGALNHQPTSSGASHNKYHYSFHDYTTRMEGSSSPSLEFGGDHEPMLLPVGKALPSAPVLAENKQNRLDLSARVNALTESYIQNVTSNFYQASAADAATSSSSDTMNGENLKQQAIKPKATPARTGTTDTQAELNYAVVATQKQFAELIPPREPAAGIANVAPASTGLQQTAVAPIHPIAAAALSAGVGNPQFLFPNFTTAYLLQKAEGAEETEEKRAKRLERNRESARKSRRRKKERLSNLEIKVNKLFAKVERERRVRINSMNPALERFEKERIRELKEHYVSHRDDRNEANDKAVSDSLSRTIANEIEQSVCKEVVEFQYNSLSQHLIERYQKFFLWMILQSESYFLSGKEKYSKRIQTRKITAGNISSKQIGEELSKNIEITGGTQTASASDPSRFWPLLCYELAIGVEQEDRILETRKRVSDDESFRRNGSQILAATRLAASLKEAVLYQSYVATFRKEKIYLDILTPQQAISYLDWWVSNQHRAEKLLNRRKSLFVSTSQSLSDSMASRYGGDDGETTLERLCQYIEESLKVSKELSS